MALSLLVAPVIDRSAKRFTTIAKRFLLGDRLIDCFRCVSYDLKALRSVIRSRLYVKDANPYWL